MKMNGIMNKYRLLIYFKTVVSCRVVPIRYYIVEFHCWVVCGIDYYKNYRRFYKSNLKHHAKKNNRH